MQLASKSFRRKGIKNSPSATWWCPEIRTQSSKVKALHKRLRNDQYNVRLKELYSRELDRYKKAVANRKRQFWLNLCTYARDRFALTFKLAHGKMLTPEQLVHTVICCSGINECQSDGVKRLIEDRLGVLVGLVRTHESAHQTLDVTFTTEELAFAVKTLKQDKAPGLDLVDVRMVRSVFATNKGVLLRLYNACARIGYFPDKWKHAEVVFFVKKGKDALHRSAYRPICLFPVLSKVLEKLIKLRLVHDLEKSGYLQRHSMDSGKM